MLNCFRRWSEELLLLSDTVCRFLSGFAGKFVSLEQTIDGFSQILAGKYDHLPEAAFYMVGHIDEVVEKAEMLAEQASG